MIARSISRPVWERLGERPFAGRVLATFEHACNLITSDNNLVTLVLPPVGNGPLNIVVDGRPGDLAAIEPGMSAWLEGRRLQVGGLEVALERAGIWEPRPDWDRLRAHRDTFTDRLPVLQALSLHHASADSLLTLISNRGSEPHEAISFAQEIAALPSATPRAAPRAGPTGRGPSGRGPRREARRESGVAVAVARHDRQKVGSFGFTSDALFAVAQEAAEALRAGWEGDRARLQRGAAQLAGLGGGLTPAGDDFLIGVMLWGWLAHLTPDSFCRLLFEAAAPRTMALSAAFLRAASEGECSASWHRLLDALQGGAEVGELDQAVREVLSHGSTSGADTLAGFLWMAK